jgi:hypothetical protein
MYISKLALVYIDAVIGNCTNIDLGLPTDPVNVPYLGNVLLVTSIDKNPGIEITGNDPFGSPFRLTVLV